MLILIYDKIRLSLAALSPSGPRPCLNCRNNPSPEKNSKGLGLLPSGLLPTGFCTLSFHNTPAYQDGGRPNKCKSFGFSSWFLGFTFPCVIWSKRQDLFTKGKTSFQYIMETFFSCENRMIPAGCRWMNIRWCVMYRSNRSFNIRPGHLTFLKAFHKSYHGGLILHGGSATALKQSSRKH